MSDKDLIDMLMKQTDILQKQIENLTESVSAKDKLIEELTCLIRDLKETNAGLEETIREFQRKLFGTSSEKTKGNKNKATEKPLDNDATDVADNTEDVPGNTYTVKEHKATRKPKSTRDDLYKNLPEKDILIPVDNCKCPWCNSEMEHLGYKFAREELRIIPAKIYRARIKEEMVKCPCCSETGNDTIVSASAPKALFPHSPASASVLADLIYKKSKDYITYYRMEGDFSQLGAVIPRETMANWCIMASERYFEPLYNLMHEELLKREVAHADETTCQVLREKDKTPESTSYMWVFTTAKDDLPSIVLYKYAPGRAGAVAREFLDGFNGLLQCDGYAGYNQVESVTLVICVAHLRRKFFEAIPASDRKKIKLLDISSEEAIKEPVIPESTATLSPAIIGVAYCNKLFYIERCIKDKSPEERKTSREEMAAPVWKAFWEFVDSLNPVGGSKLDTAVKYALNHKEEFMNYMLDGRCDLSNNKA